MGTPGMPVTSASSLRDANVSPEAGPLKLLMLKTMVVPFISYLGMDKAILVQSIPSPPIPEKASTELKLINLNTNKTFIAGSVCTVGKGSALLKRTVLSISPQMSRRRRK